MVCPGRKTGDPLTFESCYRKAYDYHSKRMFTVALPYWSALLELIERENGVMHPKCLKILDVMTTCYANTKKFEFAILALQRVIVIAELYQREDK